MRGSTADEAIHPPDVLSETLIHLDKRFALIANWLLMNPRVTILGAGSYGQALFSLLTHQGLSVTLWQRSLDLANCLKNVDMIVSALPTRALSEVWAQASPHIRPEVIIVSTSKGIEQRSLRLPSEILTGFEFGVLSGPSFSSELVAGHPTTLVAASTNPQTALKIKKLFSSKIISVETSDDITGVQVAGALKNVVAIAAGYSDAQGLGANSKAVLVTRGLREITQLGLAMGARPETFTSVAGVGDLMLTCYGTLSRNYQTGYHIAQGLPVTASAEGLDTLRSIPDLCKRYGATMPICMQTHLHLSKAHVV